MTAATPALRVNRIQGSVQAAHVDHQAPGRCGPRSPRPKTPELNESPGGIVQSNAGRSLKNPPTPANGALRGLGPTGA